MVIVVAVIWKSLGLNSGHLENLFKAASVSPTIYASDSICVNYRALFCVMM